MKFCIPSLTHLDLIISWKSILLIKNILLPKTWSKYMFELPNIVFYPMFSWFGCARQNVALVMEWFRDFCPMVIYGDWRWPLWTLSHIEGECWSSSEETSSVTRQFWLRLDEVWYNKDNWMCEHISWSHLPKTRVPMTTSTTSRPRSFQLVLTFQLAIQA